MNESQAAAPVLEPPAPPRPKESVAPTSAPARAEPRMRWLHLLGHVLPTVLALGMVAGLVYVGHRTGWRMPKFSELTGIATAEKEDWCTEHSVPDSLCVECRKESMPGTKEHGWCRQHGIHE